MSVEIVSAAALGAGVGSLLTWCFHPETDEQARLRYERKKLDDELRLYGSETDYNRALFLKEKRDIKDPKPHTLRYECQEHFEHLPVERLNRVLEFSNKHTANSNVFSTSLNLSNDATAFFKRIGECKSEYEAENCIVRFKEELEYKIKHSDIPDEYKNKFHIALNPCDHRDTLGMMSLVSCIILAAYYSSPLGLIASPIASYVVKQSCPEMRHLPDEHIIIVDLNAFISLIATLNNLVSETENSIKLKMTP